MFTVLRNTKAFVTRWVTTYSYLYSRHTRFFHIVLVCPQAATDICIHFVKCQVHERLFWEDGERKSSSPTWGNQTHDILINQTCALPQSHWLTKIPNIQQFLDNLIEDAFYCKLFRFNKTNSCLGYSWVLCRGVEADPDPGEAPDAADDPKEVEDPLPAELVS